MMQANAVITAGSSLRNSAGRGELSGRASSVVIGRSSSEEVEAGADLEEPRRADRDGKKQDNAFAQWLPQGLDVEDKKKKADRAEGGRAGNGAEPAAPPAERATAP